MMDQAFDRTATKTIAIRRRPIGFAARSAVLGVLAAILMTAAMAQSAVTTYGYSRATLPGIPGGQQGAQATSPFPPEYYLYLQVKSGSTVSARWAWVRGTYYECTLKKVNTPVLVESDPGVPTDKRETLVPKTSNDVYSVVLGEVTTQVSANNQEKELTAGNEAVIAIVVNKSPAYATIPTIKALRPAAAM
jgi:hypothetical protein